MQTRDQLLRQEVIVIIINVMLGVGTVNLPSILARTAGPDGLIALIIASVIVLITTSLIVWLVLRFPDQGIASYSTKLIGTIPGFLFNIFLTAQLIWITAMVFRIFGDAVKTFLLPKTPLEVVIISMFVPVVMLVRNGLQPIARASQIITYTFFLPFLLLPFFIASFDSGELLPIFQTDFLSVAKASFNATFALAGIEVMLIIGSHIKNKKNLLGICLGSVGIVSLLSILLVVITFGTLSIEQTAKLQDPIFETVKYIPVPLTLIQRIDIFFFTIWISATFTTMIILVWSLSHHLSETFKLKTGKNLVIPLMIPIYYIALLPKNEMEVANYNSITIIGWFAIVFGAVPLFILLSYIRKLGNQKTNP